MAVKQKQYSWVKFTGSLALLLSVIGILLAVGGQLDFLGNERNASPSNATVVTTVIDDSQKPKYSFYDELKKRKTELDRQQQTNTENSSSSQDSDDNHRYVVQVGAFGNSNDANKVKGTVEGLGYPARVVQANNKFLAQAGPFVGKKQAESAEQRLRGQKLDTLIKRLN